MLSRIVSRSLCRPLLIALVALGLVGCAMGADKSEFAGPDWSRGLALGAAALNNRPALAWEPQSSAALLAWAAEDAGRTQLRFARLDQASLQARGQPAPSRALDIPVRQPSQLRLWADGRGGAHLFWLDSREGQEPTLHHARLDAQGRLLSSPRPLPPGGAAVASYTLAQVVPEALDLFWADQARPAATLTHARMALADDELVRAEPLPGVRGAMPAAAADAQQRVHLVWYGASQDRGEGIVYARYDPLANTLEEPVWIATVPAGTMYPPEVGLDWRSIYILWSQERRGGGGGGASAQTSCRSLSLDQAGMAQDCRLALPITDRPRYEPAEGDLNYRALAPLDHAAQAALSNYTYMPYPIPGQRQEFTVLLSSRLVSRQGKGELQIVMAVLRGGQAEGYQTAGQTRSASLRPVAAVDERGDIHIAWLDTAGFGTYRVYYASTAPQVRALANRLTLTDILNALAGRVWNTAAAFSFLPMLLVWLFLPLLWLVASYLINPDRDMRTRSGRLWLGGAIILYLAAKTTMIPSFLWYAPFLDLVPARHQDFLVFGLPGMIALLSFLAMRWLLRRSERQEILYSFGVFAALDAGLSLLLYIPNMMA